MSGRALDYGSPASEGEYKLLRALQGSLDDHGLKRSSEEVVDEYNKRVKTAGNPCWDGFSLITYQAYKKFQEGEWRRQEVNAQAQLVEEDLRGLQRGGVEPGPTPQFGAGHTPFNNARGELMTYTCASSQTSNDPICLSNYCCSQNYG